MDRILSHYADTIRFTSQKAMAVSGSAEITGIDALRDYWSRALAAQPTLTFHVDAIFQGYRALVITYTNHNDVKAAETLEFGADGLVHRASACHMQNRSWELGPDIADLQQPARAFLAVSGRFLSDGNR